MIPVVPWYFALSDVVVSIVIVTAVWSIFAVAADRAVRIGSALFLGAWLVAALVLAPPPSSLSGADPFAVNPRLGLFTIVPATVVLLALAVSPSVRRAINTVSLPALHGVQVYRIAGMLFLFLLARGQVPAHFALPAGWGDIAVGVTALPVAFALARGARNSRALAIGWNLLGLLDLVVAVGMGTGVLAPFLAPELGARVPAVAAMGVFPMILIPTLAVPVSVMLHAIGLTRLLRAARVPAGPVPRPAT